MANDDELEVLDDDLLEEAELVLEDGEGDAFEDEATGIFEPGKHSLDDDGGFEDEATRVFDPNADDDPGGFEDEATRVWQSHEPEPPMPARPAIRPAAVPPAQGAFTTQLPQAGVAQVGTPRAPQAPSPNPFDDERTVITDAASVYTAQPANRNSRPQVALPQSAKVAATRRTSPWLPALALLLIGGLVAAAILLLGGRETEPVVATGTVALFTQPAGASVTVDGQRLPNATPTTLSELTVDRPHVVVLELDGFQPIEDTLVVTTDGLQQKEYQFEMSTGSVSVRTVPAGAQVAVDGVAQGVSPITVAALDPATPHEVVATLEGHEPVTRSVVFTPNGPREQLVSLSLTPVPVVEVEGSGEGSGEADAEAEAAAAAALVAQAEADAEAERAAERARRDAASERRSGSSSRSDSTSGSSSRSSRTNTREEAAEPPSRPSTTRTPSRSERTPRERPSREPAERAEPEGFGTLSVQAVPFGQVWVDGRMVAQETPLIGHRLSAGSHRVKVYFVNLRQFSDERSVRIEADGNRTVTFRAQQ